VAQVQVASGVSLVKRRRLLGVDESGAGEGFDVDIRDLL
jgi:hypothetical protein